MNETLKRAISGAVYIILLIASIEYSTESFFALFGIFLLISVYEFCSLTQLNKIVPILLAIILYGYSSYMLFNKIHLKNLDLILLTITMLVSIACIAFLFNNNKEKVSTLSGYFYLIGYIILPFIMITKITAMGEFNSNSPYTLKTYSPKIILGVFILIWTNDTFAYIVGKSIGKHKLYEKISPKKTIEGFIGGLIFAIIGGFLISKFYIQPNPNYLQKSSLFGRQ